MPISRACPGNPSLLTQRGESRNSDQRLDRQVDIVGKMASEIIGAELVFRVEPLFEQVLRPARKRLPMSLRVTDIVAGFTERLYQNQHIAAFFDRHLSQFGFFAPAVYLAVRQRIAPNVMRSEGEFPTRRCGII